MRDLTLTELDTELAEQLPARELMSRSGGNWKGGGDEYNFQSNNGQNGNDAVGLIAVGGGNNVAVSLGDGGGNGEVPR
jgi:hypothetical protein